MTQRELKFRVWDNGRKEWVHGPGNEVNLFGETIVFGEILRRPGGDIMLVVWREDLASFALRKEGWMYDHYFGEAVDAGATEIIGNIYTTPELVDPKMIEHGNS